MPDAISSSAAPKTGIQAIDGLQVACSVPESPEPTKSRSDCELDVTWPSPVPLQSSSYQHDHSNGGEREASSSSSAGSSGFNSPSELEAPDGVADVELERLAEALEVAQRSCNKRTRASGDAYRRGSNCTQQDGEFDGVARWNAVCRLQRIFRGHQCRQRYWQQFEAETLALEARLQREASMESASIQIQRFARGWFTRNALAAAPEPEQPPRPRVPEVENIWAAYDNVRKSRANAEMAVPMEKRKQQRLVASLSPDSSRHFRRDIEMFPSHTDRVDSRPTTNVVPARHPSELVVSAICDHSNVSEAGATRLLALAAHANLFGGARSGGDFALPAPPDETMMRKEEAADAAG
eukprot:SAG31_NODE_5120_length_2728_cov_1.448840_3_plen_351_part_01